MKKQKLMIVIWDLGPGGIQKRMRDFALSVSEKFPTIEVIFLIRKRSDRSFADNLQNHHNIRLIYCPFVNHTQSLWLFSIWLLIEYICIKPDIVLSFLAHYASVTAIVRRLVFWHKSVYVINEGVVTSRYLKLNNFGYLRPYVSKFYNQADKIIVPTRVCKNDLVNIFSVRPELIRIIPSWTLIKDQVKQSKKYDLIFIGRLTEEKDPLAFVEVVKLVKKRHHRISAVLIGDGPLRESVRTRISEFELDKDIDVLNYSSHPIQYIVKSRILIISSQNEGLPNVFLEAAVALVPTITFDFPGASEIITDGKTGYIVQNVLQAADRIITLLENEKQIKTIARNARNLVRNKYSEKTQDEFISELTAHLNHNR